MAQNLDPNSDARGVLQFKTGLMFELRSLELKRKIANLRALVEVMEAPNKNADPDGVGRLITEELQRIKRTDAMLSRELTPTIFSHWKEHLCPMPLEFFQKFPYIVSLIMNDVLDLCYLFLVNVTELHGKEIARRNEALQVAFIHVEESGATDGKVSIEFYSNLVKANTQKRSGVREHVSVSSLAWFMSNEETSFVTLGQCVLAYPLTELRPTIKENTDVSGWNCVADLRLEDGRDWNREVLDNLCVRDSVEAIMKIDWPSLQQEDKLLWLGDAAGNFSVKSCYMEIIKHRAANEADPIWNLLWKSCIHERLKVHLWRMAAEVLPTRERIATRLGHEDSMCGLCGEEVESDIHIFQKCHLSRLLAFGSKWGGRLDHWNYDNIYQVVERCLKPPVYGMERESKQEIQIFWAIFFYWVWKARCMFFFEGKLNLLGLIKQFNAALEEFIMLKATEKQRCSAASSSSNSVRWIPPPTGWIKVNVNAAHSERGSAAAMVVRNVDGKLLVLSSTLTSCRSSFEAELEALNWAAAFAEAGNWKQVCWEIDALEVVNSVKATEEPTNWYSFSTMLELRKRFDRLD
ncbi:hypothetical protein FNV43_RR19565 [Rhamnella rubrinervis]|uniref:RNase H type-1 domain-containing protein n=1 Tax=Rhamnella rubrinervis TaxID=2594499 RepID=A0A8K0GPM2_9ROSA|nr:hypothetical protein FNV43_RR19565 [Rhamnella rubrinervis]